MRSRVGLIVLVIAFVLGTSPATATNNLGIRWIDYQVGDRGNYIPYVTGSNIGATAVAAISIGRDRWNAQNRELNFARDGSRPKRIDVTYEDSMWPCDAALACTWDETYSWDRKLMQANIVFNSWPSGWAQAHTRWYWGTGTPGGSQYDGISVAVHEFGHAVSLTHTAAPDVMAPSIANGTTRRNLSTHDINGIRAQYGPKG